MTTAMETPLDRLRRIVAELRAEGLIAPPPRPSLRLLPGGADPELLADVPVEFTDEAVLAALGRALEKANYTIGFLPPPPDEEGEFEAVRAPLGAVGASRVANELCRVGFPSRGFVMRVSRALGRLADEGRIDRLRPRSWDHRGLCWTLPGIELAPHMSQWYPVRETGGGHAG